MTPLESPRRERFCQLFLHYLDAKKAAIEAGYSERGAKQQGHKLLNAPEVQERIRALMAERAVRVLVTGDRILDEIDALATSDIGDIVELGEQGVRIRKASEIPERVRRAIASVKVKRYPNRDPDERYELVEFRLWDKNAALRLALQHRGELPDRFEHSGPGGGPIPHAVQVTLYMPDNGRNRRA